MRFIVLSVLIAGCAAQTESVWVKPGSTDAQFYQDRGQCQAQAFGGTPMSTMQVALVFSGCMQGKGWYTEERPIQR